MFKKIGGLVVAVAPLAMVATSARAADDFTAITTAVSVAGVSAAIIAMGALKVGPNVAKWAANKLASFFR